MTNQYYFLIPTYNEEENLELLYKNLNSIKLDGKVFFVFVDDCSSDKTVETIKKLFKDHSYHIIEKKSNKGPGDSFNQGFYYILTKCNQQLDSSKTYIITMEADNTSDISILKDMLAISQLGYSLVLASVYAQGGGFQKTSFFRKMLSFSANMLFRMFFNIQVLTLSSFYRVYHLSLIQEIEKKYPKIINEDGFISMLEILIKAIEQKAKIIEVPMILKSENRKGNSKMKIIKTAISYIYFLVTFQKNKKRE